MKTFNFEHEAGGKASGIRLHVYGEGHLRHAAGAVVNGGPATSLEIESIRADYEGTDLTAFIAATNPALYDALLDMAEEQIRAEGPDEGKPERFEEAEQ